MSSSSPAPIDSARRFFRSAKDLFISKTHQIPKIPSIEDKELVISSPIPNSRWSGYFGHTHTHSEPNSSPLYTLNTGNNVGIRTHTGSRDVLNIENERSPTGTLRGTGRLTRMAQNTSLTFPRLHLRSGSTPFPSSGQRLWQTVNPGKYPGRPPLPKVVPRLGATPQIQPREHHLQTTLRDKSPWYDNGLRRRSTVIREKIFNSVGAHYPVNHVLPVSTYLHLNSTDYLSSPAQNTEEAIRRDRAKLGESKQRRREMDIRPTQKIIFGLQQEEQSRAYMEIDDVSGNRSASVSSGHSSIYSKPWNDEEAGKRSRQFSSDARDIRKRPDTVADLVGLIDDYYSQSPILEDNPVENVQRDSIVPPSVRTSGLAKPPGESTDNLFPEPEVDYDSEEYFQQQKRLLQQDIIRYDTPLLQSRYFRQALRINDIDPKCEQDADWREIQRRVMNLTI